MSELSIVDFIEARLAEDEAIAEAARDGDSGRWFMGRKWNVYRAEDETPDDDHDSHRLVIQGDIYSQSEHIARHDPARALRQVTAMRRVLAEHRDDGDGCYGCGFGSDEERVTNKIDDCPTLRALALIWSDHADWRKEWA